MRTPQAEPTASQFLGVRLTLQELETLGQLQQRRHLASRSEAVRQLVAESLERPPSMGPLPVSLETELDQIVEDGYAADRSGALVLALTLGLAEISRIHTERLPALRREARAGKERREVRKGADREGRGLLRR
ncbi:MAG: ribbon-helix-helix protein, CopG family [Thermoplasmata archaeon]